MNNASIKELPVAKDVLNNEAIGIVQKVDDDDWDLPVCTLRPGDGGFEGCESCQ